MKRLETYYLLGLSYLKTYIHLAEAHGKKIMYIHTCILAFSKTVFFFFCFVSLIAILYFTCHLRAYIYFIYQTIL